MSTTGRLLRPLSREVLLREGELDHASVRWQPQVMLERDMEELIARFPEDFFPGAVLF